MCGFLSTTYVHVPWNNIYWRTIIRLKAQHFSLFQRFVYKQLRYIYIITMRTNGRPFIRKVYYNIQCNDENGIDNLSLLATLQVTSFPVLFPTRNFWLHKSDVLLRPFKNTCNEIQRNLGRNYFSWSPTSKPSYDVTSVKLLVSMTPRNFW